MRAALRLSVNARSEHAHQASQHVGRRDPANRAIQGSGAVKPSRRASTHGTADAASRGVISVLQRSEGPYIGINADGQVTPRDYRELLRPRFLDAIERHGRLRLLFLAENFRGWSNPASMLEDAQTLRVVRRSLERVAVVVSGGWKKWLALASRPFVRAQVRVFAPSKEEEAWMWLRQ